MKMSDKRGKKVKADKKMLSGKEIKEKNDFSTKPDMKTAETESEFAIPGPYSDSGNDPRYFCI
jgi:hypothetical protein